jgi:hypothetical protein
MERKGTATAGEVSRVAVTGSPTSQAGVVTAVRGGDGRLKLITWKVDNAKGTIERVADATGVAVSDVAVTSVTKGRSLSSTTVTPFTGVVTASRDGSGNLRLDAWKVTPDLQILPAGNHVAGAADKVSVVTAQSDDAHDAVHGQPLRAPHDGRRGPVGGRERHDDARDE